MRRFPIRKLGVVAAASTLIALSTTVPSAHAGVAPSETSGPGISVNANQDLIDGWGWVNGDVTIEVWDSGFDNVLLTAGASPVDSGFQHDFAPFDVTAGQRFVVYDGVDTKVLAATDLVMTGINYAGDYIDGQGAIPGGQVVVSTWSEWPSTLPDAPAFEITADPTGAWRADFGPHGVDLRPLVMHVAVQQNDENGDNYGAEPLRSADGSLSPHLSAGMPRFVSASGYAVGATVILDIVWPDGGTHHAVQVVQAPETPGAETETYFSPPRDLEPGTVLFLTAPTPQGILDPHFGDRRLDIMPMAITNVDVGTSSVTGYAGGLRNVELQPWEPGYEGPWVRRHTFTDGSGNFQPQQFSVPGDEVSTPAESGIEDATVNLSPAGSIGLRAYDEPDFDVQQATRSNQTPMFTVSHNTYGDWGMFGSGWMPHAGLTVTIDHPGPPTPDEVNTSFTVGPDGSFQLGPQPGAPLELDINPGDVVTVSDGTTTKEHHVTDVVVTDVNTTDDTVSGTAGPGSSVLVYAAVDGPQPDAPETAERTVTADGSGAWTADFSVAGPNPGEEALHDIKAFSSGFAEQRDDDQDGTWALWGVPFTFSADPTTFLLHGQTVQVSGDGFAPNATVGLAECVTFTERCTQLGTLPTDGQGHFAGEVVVSRWVDGVDGLSGYGALSLVAFDPGNPYRHNASVQLGFQWPPSFTVAAQVGVGWGLFGSYWTPGDTVTITVDDPSTPTSPDFTTSTTVDDDGGIAVIPLPYAVHRGDTVTATDGATTKTHVVTDVAVTEVNAGDDTVSGVAAPGTSVHVMAAVDFPTDGPPFAEAADRYVTADGSGNWTAHFGSPGSGPGEGSTHDVKPGSGGFAAQSDPDGDSTWALWAEPRTLDVAPDTGLSDGQPVVASGDGYLANATVAVEQCIDDSTDCVLLGELQTNAQGHFAGSVTVVRFVAGVDAGSSPGVTRLVVHDPGNPSGHRASAPLSFLPDLGWMVLSVNSGGTFNRVSGWATISGTVRAQNAGQVHVTGTLWQRIGRTSVATGTFEVSVTVQANQLRTWTANVVPASTVPFGKGKAEARVQAEITRWEDSTSRDVVRIVTLTAAPRWRF